MIKVFFAVSCVLFSGVIYSQSLELYGDIIIGSSVDPEPKPGTVTWTGSDFLGWTGKHWISLSTGFKFHSIVEDFEGNIYRTVEIGNQLWMVENLNTSFYSNGDPIDHVIDNGNWSSHGSGAWCYYQNTPSFEVPYGKMYNWNAVVDGRGLCPTGWKVPSESDWSQLVDYLGGDQVAGGALKVIGTEYWNDPNSATNSSMFSAVGGGYRSDKGVFDALGQYGLYWSSSVSTGGAAHILHIFHQVPSVLESAFYQEGAISVRCLRLPDVE